MSRPGDWRPTASPGVLRARAELLARVRSFFAERNVLEVETPLLAAAGVTDPHLENLRTRFVGPGFPVGLDLHLQTSPEYAMKRLLAAGSGPIYQVCKAFRDEERGDRHNPEFTILEWYRPGFDVARLLDEIDELLATVLNARPARRRSYRRVFLEELGLDPLDAPRDELMTACESLRGAPAPDRAFEDPRDSCLDLLMAVRIEPRLGRGQPDFVYDYPASQAALARIRPDDPTVAERFEVFVDGVELANGFHELGNPREQRARFGQDREKRRETGRTEAPIDERLLAALESGLPDCSGVALGIDRLLMLVVGVDRIDDVLAFPIERA